MEVGTKNLWHFNLNRNYSIAGQIENHIINLIDQRQILPGDRVCSQVELAAILSVNKRTIQKVYAELKIRNVLETRLREGTFVSDPNQDIDASGSNSFAAPAPFNFRELRLQAPAGSLPYLFLGNDTPDLDVVAFPKLTKLLRYVPESAAHQWNNRQSGEDVWSACAKLLRFRKIYVEPSHLALIHGEGDVLQIVAHLLLKPGDTAVMASPADSCALYAFNLAHADLQFTGADDEGMLTEELECLCRTHLVKVVYVRPPAEFPSMSMLSERRRHHLLELSKRYHFVIIEMDEEHEFWYDIPPQPLVSRYHEGHVIYISPVSRITTLLHARRIVAGPVDFICALRSAVSLPKKTVDLIAESIMTEMISDGSLHHLSIQARAHYKRMMDDVPFILRNYLEDESASYQLPRAGLSIGVQFKQPVNMNPVLNQLEQLGYYNDRRNRSVENFAPVSALQIGITSANLETLEGAFKIIREAL